MRDPRLSLYGLVAETHARCPRSEAIREWYACYPMDLPPSAEYTAEAAALVALGLGMALGGFLGLSLAMILASDR